MNESPQTPPHDGCMRAGQDKATSAVQGKVPDVVEPCARLASGAPPVLSVILPMYNEQASLTAALRTVSTALEATGKTSEIVCVDDGSTDGTAEALAAVSREDERVVFLSLSRNFGKEAAMAAGMQFARGRAVLIMDADLQHPPDLIPKMVALWEQGYDLVNGIKRDRGRESATYRVFALLFNRLMAMCAGIDLRASSDFKLLDRRVVDVVMALPERGRFFRGLVAWVGFRSIDLEYDTADRIAGKSKWSMIGLVRYSIRNLIAFSSMPLRLVGMVGFASLIFTTMLAGWTLYRYWRGDTLRGFPTVIFLQLVIGSMLFAGLGVLSLYVATMYDEIKGRPTFVVRDVSRRPTGDERDRRSPS